MPNIILSPIFKKSLLKGENDITFVISGEQYAYISSLPSDASISIICLPYRIDTALSRLSFSLIEVDELDLYMRGASDYYSQLAQWCCCNIAALVTWIRSTNHPLYLVRL